MGAVVSRLWVVWACVPVVPVLLGLRVLRVLLVLIIVLACVPLLALLGCAWGVSQRCVCQLTDLSAASQRSHGAKAHTYARNCSVRRCSGANVRRQ